MKHRAPQYELPAADEVFNLAGELAADPDRLAVEWAKAQESHLEAQRQAQAQTDLFTEPKRRPNEGRGSAASNACFGAY